VLRSSCGFSPDFGRFQPFRIKCGEDATRGVGLPRRLIPRMRQWWRGLDSNQRTLARADLQSAAFNHSATSPGAGRRAMWRRDSGVSTRSKDVSARRPFAWLRAQNLNIPRMFGCRPCAALRRSKIQPSTGCSAVAPALRSGRSKIQPSTGWSNFGAGEGNRTLVVSLEGFCSTIELHPPAEPAHAIGARATSTKRPAKLRSSASESQNRSTLEAQLKPAPQV
jgi:hypothetical protein